MKETLTGGEVIPHPRAGVDITPYPDSEEPATKGDIARLEQKLDQILRHMRLL